jgi:ATP-dependent Lon protease
LCPLFVGRQRSIKALEEATQKQSLIFLSSQKDAKTNDPTEEDIYKIGTLGAVVQMLKLPDGTVKVLIEGKRRAKVARFIANPDFFPGRRRRRTRSDRAKYGSRGIGQGGAHHL